MTEILPFKKKTARQTHQGKTLCRHGHHKWIVDKASVFDTKQGRLVTRYRCSRCGKVRVQAH